MRRPYKVKHYKFVGIVAVIYAGTMSAMYIIRRRIKSVHWSGRMGYCRWMDSFRNYNGVY